VIAMNTMSFIVVSFPHRSQGGERVLNERQNVALARVKMALKLPRSRPSRVETMGPESIDASADFRRVFVACRAPESAILTLS